MSGIGKIFVVLNLVFSLVIVGAAAAYLSKADSWKRDFDAKNAEYEDAKEKWGQEESKLKARITNLAEENDEKQSKIDDLQMANSTLNDQLQSEKVNSQQLRDDVTKINSVLQNFQTNMNELNSRNTELANQNTTLRNEALNAQEQQRQAEENRVRIEGELRMAQEQIESLEMQVTQLDKDRVHLSNVLEVVKQQGFDISSIEAVPEIPAYIEQVNNELGFVILSVGSDDKVKKGYTFHVYRDNKYLGEVQVDDVYPDRCAARIKFRTNGVQFKVNDKASTIL